MVIVATKLENTGEVIHLFAKFKPFIHFKLMYWETTAEDKTQGLQVRVEYYTCEYLFSVFQM